MSDLIDDPAPGENAHEFTVSEISGAVKRLVEGEFGRVRVKGELGRVSTAPSGHVYLDLKDENAVLSSVIWKGQAARLAIKPEEGLEVVATGRLTTFPRQSRYQMVIEDIRPAGVGALMAMLEARKKALAAEGLFDAARKKQIPYLPKVIGVVTSPTGAVIRDILHRLSDRFPRHVLVWPVAVQGNQSAAQIAQAIEGFNALDGTTGIARPDLLIVARGGGSIEDLWSFNEEVVARAAAASSIPLISAVGHETDTTLIDFVSDQRAPTPTAAAELAVPVRRDLLSWTEESSARLISAVTKSIGTRVQRIADLARVLPRAERLTEEARQRLDRAETNLPRALVATVRAKKLLLAERGALRSSNLVGRLQLAKRALTATSGRLTIRPFQNVLAQRQSKVADEFRRASGSIAAQLADLANKLGSLDRLRQSLGYEATLARGYAVVRGDGDVVTTQAAAQRAVEIEIQFADGRLKLGSKKSSIETPEQGSLF